MESGEAKKILVVVVNWRRVQDTIACVESICATDGRLDYQVVVVDNGSGDGSFEELEQVFSGNEKVKIIASPENLGFGGGCNHGVFSVRHSDYGFVCFVNNDGILGSAALQKMYEVLVSDDSIGAVGGEIVDPNTGNVSCYGGGTLNPMIVRTSHIKSENSRMAYLTGALMLCRMRLFVDLGGFDSSSFFMYWEDTDLSVRITNKGYKLAVANGATLLHKESASLGKKSVALDSYFNQSSIRFAQKHIKLWRVCSILAAIDRIGRRALLLEFRRMPPIIRSLPGLLGRTN